MLNKCRLIKGLTEEITLLPEAMKTDAHEIKEGLLYNLTKNCGGYESLANSAAAVGAVQKSTRNLLESLASLGDFLRQQREWLWKKLEGVAAAGGTTRSIAPCCIQRPRTMSCIEYTRYVNDEFMCIISTANALNSHNRGKRYNPQIEDVMRTVIKTLARDSKQMKFILDAMRDYNDKHLTPEQKRAMRHDKSRMSPVKAVQEIARTCKRLRSIGKEIDAFVANQPLLVDVQRQLESIRVQIQIMVQQCTNNGKVWSWWRQPRNTEAIDNLISYVSSVRKDLEIGDATCCIQQGEDDGQRNDKAAGLLCRNKLRVLFEEAQCLVHTVTNNRSVAGVLPTIERTLDVINSRLKEVKHPLSPA